MTDIRPLLATAGLTQSGAARLLGVSARTMRRWCADGAPGVAIVALAAVVEIATATGETSSAVIARLRE